MSANGCGRERDGQKRRFHPLPPDRQMLFTNAIETPYWVSMQRLQAQSGRGGDFGHVRPGCPCAKCSYEQN